MDLPRSHCESFFKNPNFDPVTGKLLRLGDPDLINLEVKCEKYRIPAHHILDRYNIKQIIGKGNFGVTYKAIDTYTNQEVAVKAIPKVHQSSHLTINDEIDTLLCFTRDNRCKYIVSYIGSIDGFLERIPTTFIITEYIKGPTLTEIIDKKSKNLDRNTLIPMMTQLLLGLKTIHKAGYAHQDIKPDNLILSQEGVIVYIDFGLACIENCRYQDCSNLCNKKPGTMLYNPPEYYQYDFVPSFESAKAHDIWSLGVVLFQLANNGKFPYRMEKDPSILKENIANAPNIESNYKYDFENHTIDEFIDGILINDMNERPSIKDVLIDFTDNVLTFIDVETLSHIIQ